MRRGDTTTVLWVLAALGLMVWVVWAGGAIAHLTYTGQPPDLDPAEAIQTTANTVLAPADPAAAWPQILGTSPPPALFFYLGWIFAAAFAATAISGLLRATRILNPSTRAPSGGDVEAARWATRRDLKPLRITGPQPGRLTLGRHGRRLLAAEQSQSVLVAAPTQSGKTTGLVVPAILEWQGPVIATSVKSDLLRDTLACRRQMGEAMVFDPTGSTPHETVMATPLSGCGTWQESREMAHWLCAAARPTGEIQEASFWYGQAAKLLAPMLHSARNQGLTIDEVVNWLDQGPQAQPAITAGLQTQPRAVAALAAMMAREPKQLSSIYATAELVLACFADPAVAAASAAPQYTPERLLDGGANTLYLVAPLHEQDRLAPLFAAMIQDVVRLANDKANRNATPGKPGLDPPLLLALDELANIAPVPQLEKLASTGAAQGIQLLSVVQDFAQLRERFGPMRSQTIINNHRAKLFGTGISDPETLGYLQKITGHAHYTQHSKTENETQGSQTESDTYRDLTPAPLIREQPEGRAILIYGSLPPARIALRPWYRDRKLKELAKPESPVLSRPDG